MSRFSHFAVFVMVILTIAGCGSKPNGASPSESSAAASSTAPGEQFARLVDRYWDERINYEDAIAPQILADALDVEKRYLADLETIPREALDSDTRLSYDIFKRQRETAIEGFTYPAELMPMNPFAGMPLKFAVSAAQASESSLTVAQYERWLKAADDYGRWTRQAITNMREGVLRGYTAPHALIERMLPILDSLGADSASNVFYTPLRSMPADIAAADRERLNDSIRDAVSRKVLPATRALHDYLQHEYLSKARSGLALADLPLGSAWYEYRVRRAVGPAATSADIHRTGLAEVERLKSRLQALGNIANDSNDATATAAQTPGIGDALAAYEDLGAKVAASLPTLFGTDPVPPYAIRAVDFVLMPATPLYYRAATPTGNQAAVLFVNALEIAAKPDIAAFLQQAVPGHHLQAAAQQQRVDLPRFRRFGSDPAFVAGWGLYAATTLGDELGMYGSDADKSRALKLQMRCAVAMVVDTGIHAQGWTRAKALEYLHGQANLEEGAAQALIDEYTAMPGDALSCATGFMKIQALRAKAQQVLGARFDIHEFHLQILKDGAMPLDILEAKWNTWLEVSR
jgi:uncharacterized protein (DUF885 family)